MHYSVNERTIETPSVASEKPSLSANKIKKRNMISELTQCHHRGIVMKESK